MTTWRKELRDHFKETGDSFDNIIITLTDKELDKEFDADFGSKNGQPFTAWSDNWVYFSYEYDGADYIERVERHPPGYILDQLEKIVLGKTETESNN